MFSFYSNSKRSGQLSVSGQQGGSGEQILNQNITSRQLIKRGKISLFCRFLLIAAQR